MILMMNNQQKGAPYGVPLLLILYHTPTALSSAELPKTLTDFGIYAIMVTQGYTTTVGG